MGGHGGLNILPQKRWNVYNFDNREKVRKDEESAAKDEQIQRDQSRKHDSSIRIQQLRHLRGLAPPSQPPISAGNSSIAAGNDSPAAVASFPAKNAVKSVEKAARSSIGAKSASIDDETLISAKSEVKEPESDEIPAELSYLLSESKSELKSEAKHMNLFAGIKIFDPKSVDEKKRKRREDDENDRKKKTKKKVEEVRVIGPEDEVYRLGFGVAGKGVAKPWYAVKKRVEEDEEDGRRVGVEKKKTGKKTVQELREERLRREAGEKERERVLLLRNGGGSVRRGSGSGSGRDTRDRERRQWR